MPTIQAKQSVPGYRIIAAVFICFAIEACSRDAQLALRPVEGRLVGFSYAPFSSGAEKSGSSAESKDLRQRVERLAPGLEKWRGTALVRIVDGNFGQGLVALERAAQLQQHDARVWSDISATYIAIADDERRPTYYLRALSAAERALREQPGHEEAQFNRALALEKLFLLGPSRRAWNDYAQAEAGSRWATEAEARLASLPPEPVASWAELTNDLAYAVNTFDLKALRNLAAAHPKLASTFLEDVILGEVTSGGISGTLMSASVANGDFLSGILRDRTADPFWSDVFAELAVVRGSDRSDLLRIYGRYLEGRMEYRSGNYDKAWNTLKEVYLEFKRAGSPFQWRSLFWLGCTEVARSDHDQALLRLTETTKATAARGYGLVLGESLWMIGLANFLSGEPAKARQAYRNSLEILHAWGDDEGAASVHDLLSETLDFQGAEEEAWEHRYKALHLAHRAARHSMIYRLNTLSGVAAYNLGYPEIALYFQEESVKVAEGLENPSILSAALFWKARFALFSGNRQVAMRAADAAERAAKQLSSEKAENRALADVFLVKAEMASVAERVPILSKALDSANASSHSFSRIEILLERARAFKATGDLAGAEGDLQAAIESIDRWWAATEEEAVRTSFLDITRDVVEEMFVLEIERGKLKNALLYVERQRARELLEHIGHPSLALHQQRVGEDGFADLHSRLPSDTLGVTYALAKGRMFAWVLDYAGLRGFASWPVSYEDLAVAVRALDGDRLYTLLVEPIGAFMDPGALLVFSCSGELSGIPFSILKSPGQGRFLIEDHPLVVTPGLNVFVQCSKRLLAWRRNPIKKATIIGDPAFDRQRYRLSRLPGSAEEAWAISRVYKHSVLLLGADAQVGRLLREVRKSDVLHYSGHAQVHPRFPWRSKLILAPTIGSDQDSLLADDIYNLGINRAPVVVLAACTTLQGRRSWSEGSDSLARAFIMAGAPAVVASLWDVDDRRVSQLLIDLHAHIQQANSVAEALRLVQVKAMRSGSPPALWGGFQVFGGN